MGTISEKISYLAETKARQKTLINALGGNITNDTPFREYEQELVGVLPKVTGEGTNISLSPTIEYDLEVERLSGDTIQDGTPTPENPVDIQVVTGTQEVYMCGKNWFSSEMELGQINNSTGALESNSNCIRTKDYIRVLPNTQYAIANNRDYANYIYEYDENYTFIRSYSGAPYYHNSTFTTQANTKYIKTRTIAGQTQNNIDTLYMLELGSTYSTYQPYTSESYTLHLGDLELAKIGSYKDYIYYDNGKWYKYGAIGKVVLNGSETGWQFFSDSRWKYRITIAGIKPFTETGNQVSTNIKNNYFTPSYWNNTNNNGTYVGMKDINTMLSFAYTGVTTLAEWKTWLTTHNITQYYVLQTPSTTEITNTTLLADLNNIREKAMSYSGTTNILVEGNLAGGLKVRALKGE